MQDYEIAEAIKGRVVESASLDGKYATIYFTDGSQLELCADPPGPGAWGEYESESISVSLTSPVVETVPLKP